VICKQCGDDVSILIEKNGKCLKCEPNPMRMCRKCADGHYRCESTPDDMSRVRCDKCGHVSRM
jgi:NMD protein affecting ribosome stability and mRNA decay